MKRFKSYLYLFSIVGLIVSTGEAQSTSIFDIYALFFVLVPTMITPIFWSPIQTYLQCIKYILFLPSQKPFEEIKNFSYLIEKMGETAFSFGLLGLCIGLVIVFSGANKDLLSIYPHGIAVSFLSLIYGIIIKLWLNNISQLMLVSEPANDS